MKTYSIRELSHIFSIPPSTLRYYESEGLLSNVERNASGQRVYTDEHIEQIKCIHCFKRTGMTISQLRTLFQYEKNEAYYINEIICLLESQEQRIYEHLSQIEQDFLHIQRKVNYYKAVETALKEGKPRPEWCKYEHTENNALPSL